MLYLVLYFNMLVDTFFFVINLILTGISKAFSALSLALPEEITTSIEYFVSHFAYLSGIVNVQALFSALGFLLTFTALWYTVRIILWIFALTPWIGKDATMPTSIPHEHVVDTTAQNNVINLRGKGHPKGRIIKNTRDVK